MRVVSQSSRESQRGDPFCAWVRASPPFLDYKLLHGYSLSLIFFVAAARFLREMVPNDILAVLGVAVTLGVVVASEGARGSICESYAPRSTVGSTVVRVCVHAL